MTISDLSRQKLSALRISAINRGREISVRAASQRRELSADEQDMLRSLEADIIEFQRLIDKQRDELTGAPAKAVSQMMYDQALSSREFGMGMLEVDALKAWLHGKHSVPQMSPPLEGFKYVQVEVLLAAIERAAATVHEELRSGHPHQDAPLPGLGLDAETEKRVLGNIGGWLAGAKAASDWRTDFRAAIAAGELPLLDAVSQRPIARAEPQTAGVETAAAPPAVKSPALAGVQYGANSRLKASKRDPADVFIDAALDAIKPADDIARVWAWLLKTVNAKILPESIGTLLGCDDEGLKYINGKNQPAWLNRDALAKRLERRRRPP